MNESTQIAITEINESNAAIIFNGNGLDQYYQHIKDSVNEVPDLTTKKGRDRIASLAAQVSRSKTAVEKPGRDNLRRVKELPKALEAELRDFVNKCDALRDEVRKPLTDWEAEQARLEAERLAEEAAAKLAAEIEAAHEVALLMNREFDRDAEEKRQAAIQAQKEHEAKIAAEAAEKAKREAEEKMNRERQEFARREAEAKLNAERAEREKIEAEQREKDAIAKAEREKAESIEREKKAKEESEQRAKRMAEEAAESERKRQEQEKQREAAELAKREADKKHKAKINNEALACLVSIAELTEEQAKAVIVAIAKKQIPYISINY